MSAAQPPYSTQVIKGGAMIPETFALLQHWNPKNAPEKNLESILAGRLLGKPTAKREHDALAVLRRRLVDPDGGARIDLLRRALELSMPRPALIEILLYYAIDTDHLVRYFSTEYLSSLRSKGTWVVSTAELTQHLVRLSKAAPAGEPWSPPTARRVAQGLLSLARDFGLLKGVNPKKILAPHLSREAFAFIAYDLHARGVPDKQVVEHDVWRAYTDDPKYVEELFVRAQQDGLLYFNRAGSTMRIDWLLGDRESVVKALVA